MLSNYRSGPYPSRQEIERYIPENLREGERGLGGRFTDFIGKYLTNIADRNSEEDYFPAQVFREGARWLERNLEKNVAKEYPHICERMKNLAVADAGGKVPEFLKKLKGEPGCTPLLVE